MDQSSGYLPKVMELLNKTMPWHKLLVPEPADESTENSSEISQQ